MEFVFFNIEKIYTKIEYRKMEDEVMRKTKK